MPVQKGNDSNGSYFRWGEHGKKYYFDSNSNRSKQLARKKAEKQGRAIKASQARSFYSHGGSIDYYKQYLIYKDAYHKLIE